MLGGFSDIFSGAGSGAALWRVLVMAGAGSLGPLTLAGMSAAVAWGSVGGLSSRRMRLALPSILLALAFAGSVLLVTFYRFHHGGRRDTTA